MDERIKSGPSGKDQAVADDFAKDVINGGEDDEEYDWTIMGKSMQKRETCLWNPTVQGATARNRTLKKWRNWCRSN